MKKVRLLTILAFVFINFACCFSQNIINFQFLGNNPSPIITAMGVVGVAYNPDEAFNVFLNPAHLGAMGKEHNFLSSANLNNSNGSNYNRIAFQFGYDLTKQTGLPLRVGIGYLRQSNEDVKYIYTTLPGYYKLGKIGSDGANNSVAIGATMNYFVDISFGITFTSINSTIYSIKYTSQNVNDISASAFDAGLLISIPILVDNKFLGNFKSNINANIGYSIQNLGKDYIYEKRNIPLGLIDKLGYSITTNFKLPVNNQDFSILKIDWTAEAKENLVETQLQLDSMLLLYSSKPIFSQYNILDNLFLLNSTNNNILISYGMKLTAFDFFSFIVGKSIYGNYNYYTKGFEISTKGFNDYLRNDAENKIFGFITKHIELSFSWAKLTAESFYNYTVENSSLNLKINNIDF